MELRTEMFGPVRLACIRAVGPYSQTFPKIWPQLRTYARTHGLEKDGALFLSIAHDNPQTAAPEKIRGDACVSVPDDFTPGHADGVEIQVIPAGRFAVAKYVGPFDGLPAAWGEFCDRMLPAQKFPPREGPPFEIYRSDYGSTPPDQLVTDLYMPIG
jgi:AraC family transcriptional regulator